MGLTGCHETSVRNYHYSQRNNPKEHNYIKLNCFRLTIVDEKAINITYSECVPVTLGIQHTTRIRHTVMLPAPNYNIFSTFSHKQHNLPKKKLLNTKCVF